MEKILHIGKFSNVSVGGIETISDSLVQGLSPAFKVVSVVANTVFKTKIVRYSHYSEYNLSLLGCLARTPICPSMPYQLKKLHRIHNFSIVHLHLPNPMGHFASEILPSSVKRIISWHSDIVRQKRLLNLYQPFVNRLLKKTSAVIVATPYLAKKSKQLEIARERRVIRLIPYGIDFDYFSVSAYQEKITRIRNQFLNRFIVFAVGRHVTYKGFYYLIQAMAQLPEPLILLLGGKGSLTDQLKKQVRRLKLEERVFFLGKVPRETLPAYYHVCDVFCLPSIEENEAFGLVQLEAMACAKPVVSCDITHTGSSINQDRQTGFVVQPRSSRALAEAIRCLYEQPLLCRRLGNAAYCYAKERFTVQNMIKRVKILYRQVDISAR